MRGITAGQSGFAIETTFSVDGEKNVKHDFRPKLMNDYICSISKKLSQNYDIGIRKKIWGVKWRDKECIEYVQPEDRVVFMVDGVLRSIHQITSSMFESKETIWKENSYPFRVRISDPLAEGRIALPRFVNELKFVTNKEIPGLSFKGKNAIFNPGIEASEVDMLKERMLRQQARKAER